MAGDFKFHAELLKQLRAVPLPDHVKHNDGDPWSQDAVDAVVAYREDGVLPLMQRMNIQLVALREALKWCEDEDGTCRCCGLNVPDSGHDRRCEVGTVLTDTAAARETERRLRVEGAEEALIAAAGLCGDDPDVALIADRIHALSPAAVVDTKWPRDSGGTIRPGDAVEGKGIAPGTTVTTVEGGNAAGKWGEP